MRSVGVFDSGVGGLSVLREFRLLAPKHPVVYLADQAWAPYGERTLVDVRDRSVAITSYLIEIGCDLIVVACNSASAAALHHLRDVFPEVPFVGMEPAVKPAAEQTQRGVIGVLATDATFQGELYASVVDRHANGTEVVEQACPGLASAIEAYGAGDERTSTLVQRYVQPLREAGVDTIVLGCTHYPLVIGAISDAAGANVAVIDPAPAVARQTLRLLGTPAGGGSTRFLTTGSAGPFAAQLASILAINEVTEQVEIPILPTDVVVARGDITKQNVDALVNAANANLQHGGGVAAALAAAGGPTIQAESNAWLAKHGPLQVGGAAVTTAGDMAARDLIHVAGPVYRDGQDNEGLLRAAVSGALDAGRSVGARSIALPAISAGIYGYPPAEATAVLADEVTRWVAEHEGALDEVRLVAFDERMAALFHAALGGD